MTAMNLFARPDGAWIIADHAQFGPCGEVAGMGSKIVACDRLALAVVTAGVFAEGAGQDIEAWFRRQCDVAVALAALPALLRYLGSLVDTALDLGGWPPEQLKQRLGVAWWNHQGDQARVAVISSAEDLGTTPPFTLRPVKTMFSPPLTSDPWPGHAFEPSVHARALADAQRATAFDDGTYRVGVAMVAVRIHAGGIDERTICEWPDRKAEKIAVRSQRKGPRARLARQAERITKGAA